MGKTFDSAMHWREKCQKFGESHGLVASAPSFADAGVVVVESRHDGEFSSPLSSLVASAPAFAVIVPAKEESWRLRPTHGDHQVRQFRRRDRIRPHLIG